MPKSTARTENAAVYEIRIEMKPPIRIAGQAARTSNAQQQKEQIVPRLMFDFMATRVRRVTDRVNMQEFFGVLDMSEEPDDSDFFTWIAGVEVNHASKPPAGLVVKEFPAMLYAVITCGGMAPVGLYTYMYRDWLPKSDYESAARYAIQYHGPQFKGSLDPDSKIEVWFPVRFKTEAAAGPLPEEDKANGMSAPLPADERVPAILYDGADIDVLWDGHEDAIGWYQNHLGWKRKKTENWKPDPRASHGKMTHTTGSIRWLGESPMRSG